MTEPTQGTPRTTAEAAQTVREVVPQSVIAEAAKTPLIQAGQVQDRTLGMVIGGLVAYLCTNIPGHEIVLSPTASMSLGAACGGLGTQIAAKVPEAYRPWLQSLAAIGAVLLGITAS